jgi:hypothetical protein
MGHFLRDGPEVRGCDMDKGHIINFFIVVAVIFAALYIDSFIGLSDITGNA